jgi:hypothetical protein
MGALGGGGFEEKKQVNSILSVKPIYEGLDMEQPFKEREVRDSEGLVYYRGII